MAVQKLQRCENTTFHFLTLHHSIWDPDSTTVDTIRLFPERPLRAQLGVWPSMTRPYTRAGRHVHEDRTSDEREVGCALPLARTRALCARPTPPPVIHSLMRKRLPSWPLHMPMSASQTFHAGRGCCGCCTADLRGVLEVADVQNGRCLVGLHTGEGAAEGHGGATPASTHALRKLPQYSGGHRRYCIAQPVSPRLAATRARPSSASSREAAGLSSSTSSQ